MISAPSGMRPTLFLEQLRPIAIRVASDDAIFRALRLIPPTETVLVGLPDTIWFPENGRTEPQSKRVYTLIHSHGLEMRAAFGSRSGAKERNRS